HAGGGGRRELGCAQGQLGVTIRGKPARSVHSPTRTTHGKEKDPQGSDPRGGGEPEHRPGEKQNAEQPGRRTGGPRHARGAPPTGFKDFVKTQFGLEMTLDQWSSAKGKVLRKGGKGKARAGKPAAKGPKTAAAARKPAASPAAAGNIDLKDVAAVKDLVKRV